MPAPEALNTLDFPAPVVPRAEPVVIPLLYRAALLVLLLTVPLCLFLLLKFLLTEEGDMCGLKPLALLKETRERQPENGGD